MRQAEVVLTIIWLGILLIVKGLSSREEKEVEKLSLIIDESREYIEEI